MIVIHFVSIAASKLVTEVQPSPKDQDVIGPSARRTASLDESLLT